GVAVGERLAGGGNPPGGPSKDAAMGSLPLPVHGNYIAIARHFRDRITSVRKALAQRGDGRRERLASCRRRAALDDDVVLREQFGQELGFAAIYVVFEDASYGLPVAFH